MIFLNQEIIKLTKTHLLVIIINGASSNTNHFRSVNPKSYFLQILSTFHIPGTYSELTILMVTTLY